MKRSMAFAIPLLLAAATTAAAAGQQTDLVWAVNVGGGEYLGADGTPYAAERCDQLAEAYGERFACPPLLREMAEKGQSFYGRFNPDAKAA